MELSLQAYFDIGVSYGLGDNAFEWPEGATVRPEGATVPDILGIGIRNPLGLGLPYELDKGSVEVELWRQQAILKVDTPEMDLGFKSPTPEFPDSSAAFEEFKAELRRLVAVHPIKTCEIRIYAVGVVFLRLDFEAGVPAAGCQRISPLF